MSVRQGPTRIFSTAVIIALMVAAAVAIISQRDAIRAQWYARRLAQAENPTDLAHYAGILAGMGPSARSAAIGLLDNPRPDIRVVATILVGRLGDDPSAEALIKALSDHELDVRVSAGAQLGLMSGSEHLVPRLTDTVRTQSRDAAMAAVLSLEKISGPSASEALKSIARSHTDPVLRAQAAESLGRSRDVTAIPVLAGLLDDAAAVEIQLLGEFRDEQAINAVALGGNGLPGAQSTPHSRTVADFAERSLEQITGKTYTPARGQPSPADRIRFWLRTSPLDPTSLPADLHISQSE